MLPLPQNWLPDEIYNWMVNFMKDKLHVISMLDGYLAFVTSTPAFSKARGLDQLLSLSTHPILKHSTLSICCRNTQMTRALLLDLVDVMIFLLNWTIFLIRQQIIICDSILESRRK